jgi:hypothetical protein
MHCKEGDGQLCVRAFLVGWVGGSSSSSSACVLGAPSCLDCAFGPAVQALTHN